jgi:hypothetical protein
MGLTDWRGETFASIRKSIPEVDRKIIEEWKWMGSPVWSRDGIIAVANAHKDKVKLTFSHGRTSRILTSSLTRAAEATRGEGSIFSRAIRLMSVV